MNVNASRFFVLTGGPGSGKSAVINALQSAGYACSVEAGRTIIQQQMAIGGRALPWNDPLLFAEMMLSLDMCSYNLAEKTAGPVFFDRAIIDVLGYLSLLGLPVPQYMENAAQRFRYNQRVFIAPPWQEIYEQDRERKQDFAEALRTYEAMMAAYGERGYELVQLPLVSIEERMLFVLQTIGR